MTAEKVEQKRVQQPKEVPDDLLENYKARLGEFLEDKDLEDDCAIQVNQRRHWLVLSGWVNSEPLKARIIALVPEINDKKWIIDRLRVEGVRKADKKDGKGLHG